MEPLGSGSVGMYTQFRCRRRNYILCSKLWSFIIAMWEVTQGITHPNSLEEHLPAALIT